MIVLHLNILGEQVRRTLNIERSGVSGMTEPLFIVSREDWSLHRKGYQDQTRHQQKVREAIKKNLKDIVSDESIILSNGRETVKVPVKSIDEYRFVYNYNKKQHVGQGDGDSQVGDVLGVDPSSAKGSGKGQGAGDQAGEDYFETEVTMDELEDLLFEELELPGWSKSRRRTCRRPTSSFRISARRAS